MSLHCNTRRFGHVIAASALLCVFNVSSAASAQTLGNPSFEAPVVAANSDSLRPASASWIFSGQAGIRNNSAPNGSEGKQAAFLSAAPVTGNSNFGSVRQSINLKPGTYVVRYLASVKAPALRPQPLQLYVNGAAQGSTLNPRYITDPSTGGFEAGWTSAFSIAAASSVELRFDATNATNYGTTAAPAYAVAYLDAVTVTSLPTAFANAGFEATGTWSLSTGAVITAAADAPEGSKVLSLAAAATASQSLSLPAGQYSLSLKLGKASAAAGTLNLEVASNGAAAVTVATITATAAAEYRATTTAGFSLASGTHVFTLRASGSAFSVDAITLNVAGPDLFNSGFEVPALAAPSSATAAGTTNVNPTNATWTFSGTGGAVQTNAGSSNTSAPRTIFGKQFLALSGTGAVSQNALFAGGTYVAVAQVAQGGVKVLLDGVQVGRLAASTLDFREVMSSPFVVTAGSHGIGLNVDTAFAPVTPKLDEFRLLRVDVPPAVSITAPANGSVFQTGATVNVAATASDPDGLSALTISRTPAGGAALQLATSASSPLSTSWSNSSANTYTITASATDSTGATSATSVNIRVNANPSAIVSINPAGPMVTSAAAVSATVTASTVTDSDGTVTKIEFLQDGAVANTCTKTIPPAIAPFTCVLSLPPRAAAYSLTVRVTDNDGGVTLTTPLTLRINTSPAVTLTAACAPPCSAPGTVSLTAVPTDTDGTISKVEFYDGATLLTSKTAAPWTYSHVTAAAATHSYTAKAFDNDNASITSSTQAVTVTTPAPAVTLTATCTAPCSAPASVALTALPANIVGTVSKVEFYDGSTLLNTDTTSPYSFAAASVAAATHNYTTKVYVTGTTPAAATSAAQAVRVNALPTVTLVAACVAPCIAPATVNLTAMPNDTDGSVAKVEFYDGATLLSSKTATPWTYAHAGVSAVTHSYTAKVFDNDNVTQTSTTQSITVATAAASVALTAACTTPCNAPATVTLTALPANIVGTVSKVEFYDGATLLNTDTTSPYSFAATSVVAATHGYTVKVYATGTAVAVATSTVKSIRVNAPPTISLAASCVAPCAVLATVNLAAVPTDADGTISKVEFFDGSTLLGTATSPPWAYSHAAANAGTHDYTAKAFDSDNATKTSAIAKVTVLATAPPTVALTATCDVPCEAPASILLVARPANISGGTVQVQFTDSLGWLDALGGYGIAEADGSHVYRLTGVGVGTFTYGATASANAIVKATSTNVAISVATPANWRPTVKWLTPAQYSGDNRINALGGYAFAVNAADQDGAIADVEFFVNGASLGRAGPLNGAFTYTWMRPLVPEPFIVTAVATDNLGARTTSDPLTLTLNNAISFAPLLPTEYYTNANGMATVSIPLSVTPTPQDAQGPRWTWKQDQVFAPWIVELMENDAVIVTKKYGFERAPLSSGSCDYVWQNDAIIDWCVGEWSAPTFLLPNKTPGTYRYALRITRNPGVIWQSADMSVTVIDPTPVVTLTQPLTNTSSYQGRTQFSVAVTPVAPNQNATAYFEEAGLVVAQCTVVAGRCAAEWASGNPAVGVHNVTARVVGPQGHIGRSAATTYTVLFNQLPTVTFVAPVPYTYLREPATVTFSVTAADLDGTVSRVEFFDGNKQFIANGTLSGGSGNSVYSIALSGITEADSARQSIYARAIDDRGAVGPMGQASVVVRGAPRVQLQLLFGTPYLGDALLGFQSQYLEFEITRARYWRDGVEIGNVTTSPFRYTDFVNSTGPHSFEVEITTVWGETARSAVETIDFRDTTLATATLLQPANNATFTNPASPIALSVQSTRGRFAIASVEFYRDGSTLVGRATLTAANTYSYSWAGASPGSYSITARVTDDNHNVSVSTPVNITVLAPIVVPQAAPITSPATGSEFPAGQTVSIATAAANAATPPDPTITRIELWRVGTGLNPVDTMITSVNGNALTATLTLPSSTGELNLYTVAINAAGGRTRSAVTTLTVRTDVTDPRYFVWTNLNAALKAGNKAAALAFLTPTAQANYGSALNVMVSQATLVVLNGLSGFMQISLTVDTADYLVALDANGVRFLYGLRFVLMDDGQWKLESM
jgi:hypothetical protein